MTDTPRVTIGIATYNRDSYLGEAIQSCLDQSYESLEVLVVIDGSTNPKINEVVAGFGDDARLRVVRHASNQGIAAAYNTFVSEGRGELIAMLGDDDVSLPGRIQRQVEIFDRLPDTGVVHGDATIIDANGKQTGVWRSQDFSPSQLIQSFFFSHNHIVDPTRMVHRRVYQAVGGYDDAFPLANDMDFWLRAARRFRFRHCPGGPLTAIRRHGENTSDEQAGRAAEIADVEGILEAALDQYDLRELVPSLDWSVLDRAEGERQAMLRLAEGLETRLLPLPGPAGRLRARAAAQPEPARRAARVAAPGAPRKLMMTTFGFNDSGGGTTVPRLAAKELVRRGWDVTVFHAAVKPTASLMPYEVVEWQEDGVRLIGVHNRAHGLWDLGNPIRELDDPPITAAFATALASTAPDVVHFHNLHNLGAALIDQAAVRGIPSFFTTHNYWLICPRAYLLTGRGAICDGPGDGSRCATCVGSHDMHGHRRRLSEIRAHAESGITRILAVSDAVRLALMGSGYDPEMIDVVRQAMPHEGEIWAQVGKRRKPGRLRERLTVAFLGSAYPHKGPELLVDAAQRASAELEVRIIGEIAPDFGERLHSLDRRDAVQLYGSFAPSELGELLRDVDVAVLPSLWWDCAPLAAAECLAARVPLVVPRLGGLPEAIRDEVDGLLFNGLDASDLARQLDRLALDPALLEHLQSNIAEPRAFSEYIDTLEAYYDGQAMAARRAAPPVSSPPAIRWKGDHGLPTSLSIINDRVTERLHGDVQRVESNGSSRDSPLPHPAQVEVHHQWPPDLTIPGSGALAAIVPWEFGSVPLAWRDQINASVDELWVPSEFVRAMYTADGVDPERVVSIPNGVDLDLFSPDTSEDDARPEDGILRFLFVGGLILRKGPDLLLEAFKRAFADRADVKLVVKDFGGDGIYAGGMREPFREHIASAALPTLELLDRDLSTAELAALYRSCDVLVHPYRGEGFAMPVLEAMACGLPVIVTAGGPTDEFCPPDAGWRIRSARREMPVEQLGPFTPTSTPWMLEPDVDHLVELLREAASDRAGRGLRGLAARAAAAKLSWDAVAARYNERIVVLSNSRPKHTSAESEPFPLAEPTALNVLATPAWRGDDALAELLGNWSQATTPQTRACLYLLADPALTGSPEQVEAFIRSAANRANVDLDACADIDVLLEPFQAQRDQRLHQAIDAYVPLHRGCEGHVRLARESGNEILNIGDGRLEALIAAASGSSS